VQQPSCSAPHWASKGIHLSFANTVRARGMCADTRGRAVTLISVLDLLQDTPKDVVGRYVKTKWNRADKKTRPSPPCIRSAPKHLLGGESGVCWGDAIPVLRSSAAQCVPSTPYRIEQSVEGKGHGRDNDRRQDDDDDSVIFRGVY